MDYAQDMEEGFNGKESIVEKETGEGCSGRKAAPARGGSAAGSGRGLGSVRERAAAPAHPVSPSSFLAVLHACPVLLGEARMGWPLCWRKGCSGRVAGVLRFYIVFIFLPLYLNLL
jgi:hypothetical protein